MLTYLGVRVNSFGAVGAVFGWRWLWCGRATIATHSAVRTDSRVLVDHLLAVRACSAVALAEQRKQNAKRPEEKPEYKGETTLSLLRANNCGGDSAEKPNDYGYFHFGW